MAGTVAGGQRAAATNKAKYGKDFYKLIGAHGGTISRGGFAKNSELAREAGRKGGSVSRRTVTHCRNGHLLTEQNISWYVRSNGQRHRQCLDCRRKPRVIMPGPYVSYGTPRRDHPVSPLPVTRRPRGGLWKRLFKKGK